MFIGVASHIGCLSCQMCYITESAPEPRYHVLAQMLSWRGLLLPRGGDEIRAIPNKQYKLRASHWLGHGHYVIQWRFDGWGMGGTPFVSHFIRALQFFYKQDYIFPILFKVTLQDTKQSELTIAQPVLELKYVLYRAGINFWWLPVGQNTSVICEGILICWVNVLSYLLLFKLMHGHKLRQWVMYTSGSFTDKNVEQLTGLN